MGENKLFFHLNEVLLEIHPVRFRIFQKIQGIYLHVDQFRIIERFVLCFISLHIVNCDPVFHFPGCHDVFHTIAISGSQ